jgi:thioredoxin-like negative regulator of GroEL
MSPALFFSALFTMTITMTFTPFEPALKAAETMTDPKVKSALLTEIVRLQTAAGQFDAAIKTLQKIPERRAALLGADFRFLPPEKTEPLAELLQRDPQTAILTGRIALTMLESKNTASAWQLAETVKTPFGSDRERYDFLKAALPLTTGGEEWEKVLNLYQTFSDENDKSWAALAAAKHLVSREADTEAERLTDSMTLPIRRSWAYYEMFRLTQSANHFKKAAEIIETITLPDKQDEIETLATQLRIFGRTAYQNGWKESGERLLEKGESAASQLKMPIPRCRLQCFLGKVLVELRLIASIHEYVPIAETLDSFSSGLDRSKLSVWLAEAGWSGGWTAAMESAAQAERGVQESERADRITEILKRFLSHQKRAEPSGDPHEDSTLLSGEEFESFYFSPFAQTDCGC